MIKGNLRLEIWLLAYPVYRFYDPKGRAVWRISRRGCGWICIDAAKGSLHPRARARGCGIIWWWCTLLFSTTPYTKDGPFVRKKIESRALRALTCDMWFKQTMQLHTITFSYLMLAVFFEFYSVSQCKLGEVILLKTLKNKIK